jgi:lipoprotein-anchoring transpeptidase ErfK/SrfK
MRMAGDEAVLAAKRTLSTFSIFVGAVALAATFAVAPADAKKSKAPKAEQTAVDKNQPMTIIISLRNQKANIYRGTTLITSTRVSTGKRGHATKAGVYSILEKRRRHYSNLYGGAPMPYMQRLTWTGTALHAGVVPGYPASHGCVRLPRSFAPKLFKMTGVGEQVVVARTMVAPKPVEHSALFQPLPPPMPPIIANDHERNHMRRSSNDAAPTFRTHLPVVLAKAQAVVPQAILPAEAKIVAPVHAPIEPAAARPLTLAVLEDTRDHAIDPAAAPFMGSGSHTFAVKPSASSGQTHATVGTSDDFVKHQDLLADPAEKADAPSIIAAVSSPAEASEPQGGPILKAGPMLTVSAEALSQPALMPASVAIAPDDHPPVPPLKPSAMAAKLLAGMTAAAVEAAEPRSTEPLRVLITRRTKRDRMIDVQHELAAMGYLEQQGFDGTFGRKTIHAIKAFQKANDLPESGAFTDELVKKVYAVAGKEEPPAGRLFVRQKFTSVFDTPVRFRNPDAPLGTHVFTVQHFAKGDTKAQWIAISLKPEADPTIVLDRIEIPEDVRQNISERLTAGSSLIIADTAINSATLPKGADFLVWDTSKPSKIQRASVSPRPRRKKRRRASTRRRTAPTYARRPAPSRRHQRNPWHF